MRTNYCFYQVMGLVAVLLSGVVYAVDSTVDAILNPVEKPKVTPKPHPKPRPKVVKKRHHAKKSVQEEVYEEPAPEATSLSEKTIISPSTPPLTTLTTKPVVTETNSSSPLKSKEENIVNKSRRKKASEWSNEIYHASNLVPDRATSLKISQTM